MAIGFGPVLARNQKGDAVEKQNEVLDPVAAIPHRVRRVERQFARIIGDGVAPQRSGRSSALLWPPDGLRSGCDVDHDAGWFGFPHAGIAAEVHADGDIARSGRCDDVGGERVELDHRMDAIEGLVALRSS